MIFLNNKYTKIYFCLIEKSKNQSIDGYFENHHIIPKCLGGKDTEDNLIKFTARQHFVAHLLLTKMCNSNNKYKLYNAFSKMLCNGKDNKRYLPSSKFYEYSKKLMAEYMKNNNPTKREDVRKKMSENSWAKSEKAEEIKKLISQLKIGKKLNLTDEQRKNRSEKRTGQKNGMYGKTHSKETREKLSFLKTKEFELINVNTGEVKKIINAKKYFENDKKKYILFNNCKQNKRLFEGCWEIKNNNGNHSKN